MVALLRALWLNLLVSTLLALVFVLVAAFVLTQVDQRLVVHDGHAVAASAWACDSQSRRAWAAAP